MPECKNALQEDLKAYLDGELPTARRVAVERHLTGCAACTSELEGLRLLSTTLTETLPASAPLPDALRARILASLPEAPTPRPLFIPFWRRPGPMAAFSGVLAMSCAAWLWVRTSSPKSVPQEPVSMPAAQAPAYVTATELPAKGTIAAQTKQEKPAAALSEAKSAVTLPARENTVPQAPAPAPLAQGMTAETFSRVENKPLAPAAKPRQAAAPSATAPEMLPAQAGLDAPADHVKAKVDTRSRNREGAHLPETALSSTLLPSEALANAQKMESETSADATGMSRAMQFAAPLPPPQAYTLTVPKGKKPETEEALRKLGEELSIAISRDKTELELVVASPGRAALLERLKALGKLTETPVEVARNANIGSAQAFKPSAPSHRGGGFGGGGAFGSASPRAGTGGGPTGGGSVGGRGGPVLLKLTLIIKESESEEVP